MRAKHVGPGHRRCAGAGRLWRRRLALVSAFGITAGMPAGDFCFEIDAVEIR